MNRRLRDLSTEWPLKINFSRQGLFGALATTHDIGYQELVVPSRHMQMRVCGEGL